MMETMYYPDEIRGTAELEWPSEDTKISDAELAMANMLIEQLTGDFKPEEYHDEYREALTQVIEEKLGTGAVVAQAPEAPQGKVRDLMEALRESIEAAKAQRGAPAKEEAPAEEEAKAPKKRARKAG
jgi:DNA end-binding protein Ku